MAANRERVTLADLLGDEPPKDADVDFVREYFEFLLKKATSASCRFIRHRVNLLIHQVLVIYYVVIKGACEYIYLLILITLSYCILYLFMTLPNSLFNIIFF